MRLVLPQDHGSGWRATSPSPACVRNTEAAAIAQASAEFVYLQAERAGNANVFPVGGGHREASAGRGKGRDPASLVDGGAVAFADDDNPVVAPRSSRRALGILPDVRQARCFAILRIPVDDALAAPCTRAH